MHIDNEIQEIKARLDRIEAFLRAVSHPAEESDDSDVPSYELLDFQVKRSQSLCGPEYAYRLTVKNSGMSPVRFSGWIIFLDSEEFEVVRHPVNYFTVQPGQVHAQTGKETIFDGNHAHRISDVTAEIHPA